MAEVGFTYKQTGQRNPRSRFKGYHMFENARKRIEGNQSMFDKYVGRAIERAFE
jgi:hypothetical protein